MNKLDFLIVGTQKGGTTALNTYLKEHPSICMGNTKEIHYFDTEENFISAPDYEDYHKNFSINKHTKVIGEATPIYMYWESSMRRIWEYNKNIKIIILLRDPIQRAYSHWNMETQRGLETISFSKAIRTEYNRVKVSLPDKHRVYSYVDRGFYNEQIKNVFRYFNKSQVLIVESEKLEEYLNDTLKIITDFLNISQFNNIEHKSIHKRNYKEKISEKDYKYLQNIYKYDVKMLENSLNRKFTNWLKPNKKIKVLFFRNYVSYTGGHQVLYDYYKYLKDHGSFDVNIFFDSNTKWNVHNPWIGEYKNIVNKINFNKYDMLFVAGVDWKYLPDNIENKKIVINLIQGMRHSNPDEKLYSYLKRKAFRICVSNEVNEYLNFTNEVNGLMHTIENAVKLSNISINKEYDFYLLGVKNKNLATQLYNSLVKQNYKVKITINHIGREDVHKNMALSKITILLPNINDHEGFYIPALESMKYSDITIVPDCIGNRSFCKNNINCLIPEYNFVSIISKALFAINLINNNQYKNIKKNASRTLNEYTKEKQKEKFYKFLRRIMNV